ncbi:SDR family NAD(P)-dependent oxidoreductase [Streptomyces puniciscabiei]|uniref:SDR family NAD(P)-dependent oxidoreductase n=1 Tax=Streptomyces puniciscabiei TaxID=164348 RepID=UPI003330F68A
MSRDQRTAEQPQAAENEPIAIVGIGLRLPGGAESPDEFDAFLRAGRSGIRTIPEDRWDVEAFRPGGPDDKGKITTTSGGFLDRIDLFDAPFFNISPKEARYIDPQQRIVLETAWQALEQAGIDPTPLRRGTGGVYMGVSSFDYGLHMGALPYEELDGHLAAGSPIFAIAGRVSYFLGWRGPSICVDSACSSSLSALHLAVQGLRSGECEIALCGGVNAVHHPSFMVMFSHGQMLASDGQCKTFDESADGYSRAEGCGMLVLKRLSDARRDGDDVIALIRGTAIGQDGDSAGLTVPHGPAQELVIRQALAAAGLTPDQIQYVEAHGTGTPLGDPIELGAISNVFAKSHTKEAPLVVGSVKTNIGHMEPASGIVGVIKTVLQLRSSTIYPHLNFTEPSRRIPWDTYPVTVPTEVLPWNAETRRAVVNSFGFAGTIAATVLEQAPAPTTVPPAPGPASTGGVFTLSGKNSAGLRRQAENYRRFLDTTPDLDLARLCYTTNVGRAHFSHRLAGVVNSHADLAKLLDAAASGEQPATSPVRKVAFLFSGQGTQYAGMGAALYERFPVFREHVDECDRLFAPHLAESVRALILGTAEDGSLLDQTGYTQPALFTFEYALARLWMSWGVQPSVLIGHSIGEVAAAAVAGLFSLPDAVTLVATRARLMQSVRAAGGMAAVSLPHEQVLPLLADRPGLALAAVNAPDQCVVSGAAEELAALCAELRERGVRVDSLAVSHAFHSPLMAEVFDEFKTAVAGLTFHQPDFPLISNTTGSLGRFNELGTADYWVRHIGEPVLFMSGVQAVEQRGRHAFVEIGPSTALTALAKRCISAADHHWAASVRRRDRHGDTMLRSLAELYTAGVGVSWTGVHAGAPLPKMQLPTYAFERKRYWLPAAAKSAGTAQGTSSHPLLGRPVDGPQQPAGVREFAAEFTAGQPAFLAGHVGPDGPVLPAGAYVEMLLALQDAVYGETRGALLEVALHEPLPLPEESAVGLRTRLLPQDTGDALVEVVSGPAEEEQLHATARVAGPSDRADGPDKTLWALADTPGEVLETVRGDDIYTDFASVGRHYGGRYRLLTEVSRHQAGVLTGELTNRDASAFEHLPAEILECAVQAAVAIDDRSPAFTPVRFGSVRLFRKPRGERLRVVARVAAATTADERHADVLLLDGDTPVAELRDVVLARPGRTDEQPSFLHRLSWLRHSATARPDPADRHVLVLGGDRDRLAAAEKAGVRLTHLSGAEALPEALGDTSVTDVCWFWRPDGAPMSAGVLRAESERNYRELLAVMTALTGAGPNTAPRLWLVTERAQWLPEDRPGTGEQLAAATLWGFGHVLLNEYPRYRATLIDLPAGADLGVLADEWRAKDTGDFQIAHRDGRRYVRRLLAGETTPAWDGDFELRAPESGDPADLRPVAADDTPPGPGQVQVLVHTAAVHSGEAGAATGDGSRAPAVLGSGCSGTVLAVGAGVAEFAAGDRVVVCHRGTLRRTVTVPAGAVAPVPDGMDLVAAAALPTAYVTAAHALDRLAPVPSGATVLVAAAGAPGRALAALAARAGHTVIAAAEAGLRPSPAAEGVRHVLDPDAADPVSEVLRLTGGRGVDAAFIAADTRWSAAGCDVLAEGGRSVVLGSGLPPLPDDDVERLGGRVLRDVAASVGHGELPAVDTVAFVLDEADEALVAARGATAAQPVVVLGAGPAAGGPEAGPVVRPDRTYLISGGLGGLGLVTATKLVDLGARHLVLVSRSGSPTPEAEAVLDALSGRCEIELARADLGDAADVEELFAGLRTGSTPLGGIVHAAGRAGSSLIGSLSWQAIDEQLRAQAYGGWLLHEASLDFPDLDFFVVHSSIAAVVGGSTQAHYAAAFAFLDGLVAWRTRQGLPALATNWGMWSRVGMSARLEENLARELERTGMRFFSPARALRTMTRLLPGPAPQYVAGEWDWNRYVSLNPLHNALYSRLLGGPDAGAAQERSAGRPAVDLTALVAKPEPERVAAVGAVVLASVAAALHAEEEEEIDPTTEFVSLGLDSLMALELKTSLESVFRVALPASLAFDYPSPQLLTEFLDAQLVPRTG